MIAFGPDGLDTTEWESQIEKAFGFEICASNGNNLKTLGEVCQYIASEVAARGRTMDDEVIWTKVRQITSEELGVDQNELTKDVRFVEDLNF